MSAGAGENKGQDRTLHAMTFEEVLKEMSDLAKHPLGNQLLFILQPERPVDISTDAGKKDIELRVRFLLYYYFCTEQYENAVVVINLLEMNNILKNVLTKICEKSISEFDVIQLRVAMECRIGRPFELLLKANQDEMLLPLPQMLFKTSRFDLGDVSNLKRFGALNKLRLKFIQVLGLTHHYRFGGDAPSKTGKKKTILRSILENKCVTVFTSLVTNAELKYNLDFVVGGVKLAVLLCQFAWADSCIIAFLKKYPKQGYLLSSPKEGVEVNLLATAVSLGRGTLVLAMLDFYIGSTHEADFLVQCSRLFKCEGENSYNICEVALENMQPGMFEILRNAENKRGEKVFPQTYSSLANQRGLQAKIKNIFLACQNTGFRALQMQERLAEATRFSMLGLPPGVTIEPALPEITPLITHGSTALKAATATVASYVADSVAKDSYIQGLEAAIERLRLPLEHPSATLGEGDVKSIQTIHELRAKHKAASTKLKNKTTQLEKNRRKVGDLEGRLRAEKEKYEAIRITCEELRAQQFQGSDKNKELMREIAHLKDQVKQLKSSASQAKKAGVVKHRKEDAVKLKVLTGELVDAKAEINKLNKQATRRKGNLEAQTSAAREANKKVQALLAKVQSLRAKEAASKQERQEASVVAQHQDETIAGLQSQLACQVALNESQASRVKALESQAAESDSANIWRLDYEAQVELLDFAVGRDNYRIYHYGSATDSTNFIPMDLDFCIIMSFVSYCTLEYTIGAGWKLRLGAAMDYSYIKLQPGCHGNATQMPVDMHVLLVQEGKTFNDMEKMFITKQTASHRRKPINVHQFLDTPLLPVSQIVSLSKELPDLYSHVKDLIKMLITNSVRGLSENTQRNLDWLRVNCNNQSTVKSAIESAKKLYGVEHLHALQKLLLEIGYIHPASLSATATTFCQVPLAGSVESTKPKGEPVSPASSTSVESDSVVTEIVL